MAKPKDSFTGVQADLFSRLDQEPMRTAGPVDLGLHDELRGALAGCIRRARTRGISRERLVDELNRLQPQRHRRVTLRLVNGWTASSCEAFEMPAGDLGAFCAAVGDLTPLRVICQALGYELVDARGLAAVELGSIVAQRAALARRERELKERITDGT